MRRLFLFLPMLVGATLLFCRSVEAARHPVDVEASLDISYFYDQLSPYGEWVEDSTYGYVWSPNDVDPDWRPYTRGHWVYTDEDGWLWVADEEWGWGPYHYGRWFISDNRWVWVPGTDWAPAWVSWRTGGGYIGWAPLPPQAVFAAGVGIQIGPVQIDAYVPSGAYCFVEERHFADDRVASVIVPRTQNITIVNVTKNITNYNVVQNRVVNGAVRVAEVERAVGHPVARVQVAASANSGPQRANVQGNQVRIFRPAIHAAPAGKTLAPPKFRAAAPRREAAPEPQAKERGGAPVPAQAAPKGPEPAVHERGGASENVLAEAQSQLAARHAQEKADLEKRHTQELQQPPKNVTAEQLKAKHDGEKAALQEKQQKEVQQLAAQKKPQPKPSEKPH
jgi:hypothetical protein